ncbi:MAG: nucleoside hydrolase [Caldisericaceae bacterium]|nr:nucleoside hydrolase [Caldisericaceae bacterium]
MTNKLIFLVFVAMFVTFCTRTNTTLKTQEKIRVILDTDANNELDDQHAIAYMLFSGKVFDVEGITVNKTYNGGSIDDHYAEAVRIVKLCNLYPDIPVYKGATGTYKEIVGHLNEENFDGSDAVNFIIERAHAKDHRKLVLLGVGKLTNITLAIKKDPSIIDRVRIVWLGSNYPDPGEYNLVNDTTAINPLLESSAEFEMVMVRYGKPSGTDAVVAYLKDFQQKMPGKGPHISTPVTGRHGGKFTNFGDYSVNLFENFRGHPSSRPLFDMAAVSIVKNPAWAERVEINAPKFVNGKWVDRPNNPRKIVIWENFDKDSIMADFYRTMEHYVLAKP